MRVDIPLDIEDARRDKIAEITRACEAAITGGFVSSALGSVHIYPCTAVDQLNLLACVAESNLPSTPANWKTQFTCVTPDQLANEDWPLVDHTAEQIQQVGRDAAAWIRAQRVQRKSQLIPDVRAAQTLPAVLAIRWSNGVPASGTRAGKSGGVLDADVSLRL